MSEFLVCERCADALEDLVDFDASDDENDGTCLTCGENGASHSVSRVRLSPELAEEVSAEVLACELEGCGKVYADGEELWDETTSNLCDVVGEAACSGALRTSPYGRLLEAIVDEGEHELLDPTGVRCSNCGFDVGDSGPLTEVKIRMVKEVVPRLTKPPPEISAASPFESPAQQIEYFRSDCSTYLVHLTRGAPTVVRRDNVDYEGEKEDLTAPEVLWIILKNQRLIASRGKGMVTRGVCFTEKPLQALRDTIHDTEATSRKRAGSLTWPPYGRSRGDSLTMLAALQGLRAMKLYDVAGAPASLVKSGREIVEDMMAAGDPAGARQVIESAVLPVVVEHKLVELLVPVRALYAAVCAACGDISRAEGEMRSLGPCVASLDPEGRRFVDAQQRKVRQFRADRARRLNPKVGVNDPCPCGSGKKFKKCCARSSSARRGWRGNEIGCCRERGAERIDVIVDLSQARTRAPTAARPMQPPLRGALRGGRVGDPGPDEISTTPIRRAFVCAGRQRERAHRVGHGRSGRSGERPVVGHVPPFRHANPVIDGAKDFRCRVERGDGEPTLLLRHRSQRASQPLGGRIPGGDGSTTLVERGTPGGPPFRRFCLASCGGRTQRQVRECKPYAVAGGSHYDLAIDLRLAGQPNQPVGARALAPRAVQIVAVRGSPLPPLLLVLVPGEEARDAVGARRRCGAWGWRRQDTDAGLPDGA